MNRQALWVCAVTSMFAQAALGDPFDNELWYRGAPPEHRTEMLKQLMNETGLKDKVPKAMDLGAFGNPARSAILPNEPRDIHGRFILGGPLSSSDGLLNAAGDAMGVSIMTPKGVLPIDSGEDTRLADQMHQREYGKPVQPVQMIIAARDLKVLEAIALFTSDLEDEDVPQHVRGELVGLNRTQSATGGLSRLIATINTGKQKLDVVLNTQDQLTKANIQLGDEVMFDTDRRVVEGKAMIFAVGIKHAALPAEARRD